ncbi:tumor necrosis factor receptor superfamily member 11A [Pelobates fuscus]|uniref:tumor necrosis factor receptor superfamily member 11A n=1 Tax=Pelobates fuscus TaxID=191477 RepID=UPI002FE43BC8
MRWMWIVWVLSIWRSCLCSDQGSPGEQDKQYFHEGHMCNKCQPGTYMEERCSLDKDTICIQCGPNEYLSHWNDELKCSVHPHCDDGKGLVELHPGNRTSPRQCVCKEGYYFDVRFDICSETSECPPGFGPKLPVKENEDTECIPCPVGYFSSTLSKQECKSWTNCTYRGLEEKVPGTNRSDAVCIRAVDLPNNTVLIGFFVALALVLVIVVSLIVYCCKHFPNKKANILEWWEKMFQGPEKTNPIDNKNKVSNSPSTCYTQVNIFPDQQNCVSTATSLRESLQPLGRSDPIENEYQERSCLIGDESIVTRTGSMPNMEGTSLENETSPVFSEMYSPSFLYNGFLPDCSTKHACGQCARQCSTSHPDNSEDVMESLESVCSHCSSQNMSDTNSSQATYSTPVSDIEDETNSRPTNRQCPCSSNGSPGSSPTTDPLSGNMAGNNTFYSNGAVMNIRADLVVLVVGPQETAPAPESNDVRMGSAVQEENQDHCDSFVGNTEPHTARHTDFGYRSQQRTATYHCMRTGSPGNLNVEPEDNICSMPVQEEGKKEFDKDF